MLRQLFFLAMLGVMSDTAFSAQLTLDNSVDMVALNGKGMDEQRQVNLPLGTNQIVIRYIRVLRDGTSKKKFESVPYVFRLRIDNDLDEYSISLQRFREYSVAQATFDNNKVDWQIEKNGLRIPTPQMTMLPGNKGIFPYSDIELAVKNFNNRNGVTLVPLELSSQKESVIGSTKHVTGQKTNISKTQDKSIQKIELKTSDTFVTKIKNWYLDASSEQRKALMKWMIEQQ